MQKSSQHPHSKDKKNYNIALDRRIMRQRSNYQDITRSLKSQIAQHIFEDEMVRASEKKYRVLVENLPQKIFHKDKNSVYISCNKKYADDLKIAPEQIVGKTDYDFYSKELAEKYRADDKRIIKSGTVETIEEKYTRNGKETIVQTVKAPIKDEAGDVTGVLGIFWDITERKIAEQKLMEYQQKLKAFTSQLTLIEERERRRFAEYLHNEIGQNLFAFQMQLEQLKNSLTTSDNIKTVKTILNNIKQVIKNSRSLTYELGSPILYELGLEKALEWLVEQTYKQHNIVVALQDDKQEKPLDDDMKIFLYQAVRELFINVSKHAKTEKATVSIEKDNSNIKVCVKDNGVGFDPSRLDSIDSMKDEFGLFHIKERLEQLGGRFHVKSKLNDGTQVILIAPLKS